MQSHSVNTKGLNLRSTIKLFLCVNFDNLIFPKCSLVGHECFQRCCVTCVNLLMISICNYSFACFHLLIQNMTIHVATSVFKVSPVFTDL